MSFGNSAEWMLEIDRAKPIVNRALDLGINFFDTANVYSNGRSEEIVGELLKDVRDDVVIATKVWGKTREGVNNSGLSRLHIMMEAEKSLKRLGTDRIDLYQTHRWD
jgi:1-deoxyxylulose-5-phosphate synthase